MLVSFWTVHFENVVQFRYKNHLKNVKSSEVQKDKTQAFTTNQEHEYSPAKLGVDTAENGPFKL